jgi:hypothetical protein
MCETICTWTKEFLMNENLISTTGSRAAVRVIHTDEELMIAETVCDVMGFDLSGGDHSQSDFTNNLSVGKQQRNKQY